MSALNADRLRTLGGIVSAWCLLDEQSTDGKLDGYTPEILDAYMKAFDPTFVALYGTLEETAATAKEFDVFYEKVAAGDTYTISHTATSYVYDSNGGLRLGLSTSLSAEQCTEDLLTVMEVC